MPGVVAGGLQRQDLPLTVQLGAGQPTDRAVAHCPGQDTVKVFDQSLTSPFVLVTLSR